MPQRVTRTRMAVLALGLATAFGGSAFAHHAFNMYDNNVYSKMTGTVTNFRWANPHTMIEFMVLGADGKETKWTAECSPTNMLRLHGWTLGSLKAGDKIDFVIHPNRNGANYGLLVSAGFPDGRKLTDKD
ncbi:MAG TPA: DUF6152 family protein [Caulobacteraceae bacterium]|nr:DUF6152 family protein [Caulobacteraceae bacterium]